MKDARPFEGRAQGGEHENLTRSHNPHATAPASPITTSSTAIVGLAVTMPRPCRACGSYRATIGSSRGPHWASYVCADCGGHAGWMARHTFEFIGATVRNFGRPDHPIIIRLSSC